MLKEKNPLLHLMVLAGPISGTVAVSLAVVVVVPFLRRMVAEVGFDPPMALGIFLDYGALLAAGAVVLCVAAVMTIEWSPKRSVRIISSVAITLLLFLPLVALLIGFWSLYAAMLDHAGRI